MELLLYRYATGTRRSSYLGTGRILPARKIQCQCMRSSRAHTRLQSLANMRWYAGLCVLCVLHSVGAEEACGDEVCSLKSKDTGWQKGKFVLDSKPVVRETLGHCSWTFLHSVAAYLPHDKRTGVLDAGTKKAFVDIVLALRKVYACSLCRRHFDKMLSARPALVRKLHRVSTRDDAVFFMYMVHNLVTAERIRGHKDQKANTAIKLFAVGAPAGATQSEQVALFTQNLLKPFLHDTPTEKYQGARKAAIEASLVRWSWSAFNEKKAREKAAQARSARKDPFDLRLENSIAENEKLPPLRFAHACRANIASPGSAYCGKIRRVAAAYRNGARLPFHAFVMGRCPWCALWMSYMKPILEGFGQRLDFKLSFILDHSLVGTPRFESASPREQSYYRMNTWHGYTSMHGRLEAAADAYELCAQKLYNNMHADALSGMPKWLAYIECMDLEFDEAGPARSQICAPKHGLDHEKIQACAEGATGKHLLDASIREFQARGIDSAPTFIIANTTKHDGVARTGEVLKMICPALACLDKDWRAHNPTAAAAEHVPAGRRLVQTEVPQDQHSASRGALVTSSADTMPTERRFAWHPDGTSSVLVSVLACYSVFATVALGVIVWQAKEHQRVTL